MSFFLNILVAVLGFASIACAQDVMVRGAKEASGVPSWKPVSGTQLWLDASQESYKDGQTATTWTDRVGTNVVTSSGAKFVKFSPIGNRPAFWFDGTNTYFTAGFVMPMGTNDLTVFSVVRKVSTTLNGCVLAHAVAASNNGRYSLAVLSTTFSGSPEMLMQTPTQSVDFYNGENCQDRSTILRAEYCRTQNRATAYSSGRVIMNNALAADTSNATTSIEFLIGRYSLINGSGNYNTFLGWIAEIIIVNRTLSAAEIQDVEVKYLRRKYRR